MIPVASAFVKGSADKCCPLRGDSLPSLPMTQEQIKDMRSRLAGLGRYL
jgi:hypothetical protein